LIITLVELRGDKIAEILGTSELLNGTRTFAWGYRIVSVKCGKNIEGVTEE
jgi:hypothetical protein